LVEAFRGAKRVRALWREKVFEPTSTRSIQPPSDPNFVPGTVSIGAVRLVFKKVI
jgi:hypothetical protein